LFEDRRILWDHPASVARSPWRRSSPSLGGRKLWRGSSRDGARCRISVARRQGRREARTRTASGYCISGPGSEAAGSSINPGANRRRLRHCCCWL
jgi:hypothetical protein